jgi:putative aldouronate transport system substrate-binding protein
MKERKKQFRLMLPFALAVVVAAGCSSSKQEEAAKKPEQSNAAAASPSTLPPVKLTWLMRMSPQNDLPAVQEAVNKITKEKLNAEVELRFIDPGTFDGKLKTMIAAGENFDITFASSSIGGDFYGSVGKGAFLPLDELISKYAPKAYASIPQGLWKAVVVDKKIYGVPNYQIVARENGIAILKSIADKYSVNLDSIKKLDDLEAFFAKVKSSEPAGVVPFVMNKTGMWKDSLTYYGFDTIMSPTSPGTVKLNDDLLTVVNQFADPKFKEHVNLIRSWFQKGYINKDAAMVSVSDVNNLLKSGNAASMWNPMKPGGDIDVKVQFGDRDIVMKSFETPFVTTSNVSATLQTISRTSKNPERAMMLLELVNTDKPLFNLLSFGLEGKHYKKLSDNRIEPISDSGYFPNKTWAIGNQFNAYLLPGQPDNVWQETIKLNERAAQSKLMGFVFDTEPVKAEVAQAQSVADEFLSSLLTGAVDPDKYLPQFLDKLKTAGADRIVAEKQKQINEWKAKK